MVDSFVLEGLLGKEGNAVATGDPWITTRFCKRHAGTASVMLTSVILLA